MLDERSMFSYFSILQSSNGFTSFIAKFSNTKILWYCSSKIYTILRKILYSKYIFKPNIHLCNFSFDFKWVAVFFLGDNLCVSVCDSACNECAYEWESMYVYMYVCEYVFVCLWVGCVCIRICVYAYVCMYVFVCVWMSVYGWVCMGVSVYLWESMCVCVCVCVVYLVCKNSLISNLIKGHWEREFFFN